MLSLNLLSLLSRHPYFYIISFTRRTFFTLIIRTRQFFVHGLNLYSQGGVFSMSTNFLSKYEAVSHLLIQLPTGNMNVDGRQ
jgi:hypothetical protein